MPQPSEAPKRRESWTSLPSFAELPESEIRIRTATSRAREHAEDARRRIDSTFPPRGDR